MVRAMLIAQFIIITIPSILWIGSIYVELPRRFAIIAIAIFVDLTGTVGVLFLVRGTKYISGRLAAWADRVFEFYPATNIEHKTERTNAFVTLVSVVAIIYQSAASSGLNASFSKAVLGLIEAFAFNWIYFDLDGTDLFAHVFDEMLGLQYYGLLRISLSSLVMYWAVQHFLDSSLQEIVVIRLWKV